MFMNCAKSGISAPDQAYAALSGVTAPGFDTSPFIYIIEQHTAYVRLLRELFLRVDSGTIKGFSSVVTLTELLTKPKQVGATAIENEYRHLLLNSRNFTLVPIDSTIAELAAELRARHRLRTPDALQIAAAISVGCEAFVTNDDAPRRVAALRVLVLDELEL